MNNKTKIVCTLNSNQDIALFDELIEAGMDVARLNFSHMSLEDGQLITAKLKEVRKRRTNRALALMMDTKGPEVRLYGYLENIIAVQGEKIKIESYLADDIKERDLQNPQTLLTNLPELGAKVTLGQKVLLMDGYVEGIVVEKTIETITIELRNSGELRPKAHLTIPNINYDLPFLSDKDANDIKFAVENEFEYIALSFVSKKQDIYDVRKLISQIDHNSKVKLISKIENKQAVENLQEIINSSDGVMVARGDLGVELDIEDVPIIQKQIIKNCYLSGKPVITATQMLESMIDKPVPTRAEASDVANACYDLTSAVMLSGETAIGKYPRLVVETMNRIIGKVEASYKYDMFFSSLIKERLDRTSIIAYNAISTAYQLNAKALMVFTLSGYSARMVSKLRPGIPIYAFTPIESVYNQLALNWGINPYLLEHQGDDFEEMVKLALKLARKEDLVKQGDSVVIVAGLPMGKHGTTNMIRLETVEKATVSGKVLHSGIIAAPIIHINSITDLQKREINGKIVLLRNFDNSYVEYLKSVGGIVTENELNLDILQYIAERSNIPTLVNAKQASEKIPDGTSAELNGEKCCIQDI
ncbi:MAG: pyruvate kinase [Candidatus Cloacimonadales bacterium]